MEEENNNNNDKGAMETIKKTAKNEANKVKNKVLSKIMIWLAPFIGILLLCLLAIGVLMATAFSIMNFFSGLLGTNEASATVTEEVQSIISLTDSGYQINSNYSEQILEELEKLKVDTEVMGFSTDEVEDMIGKYIQAEVKTMYPKLGIGEIDGIVQVRRVPADGSAPIYLQYMKYDTFCEKVEQNDESVLNYFSLNPENFYLCLAVSDITTSYDYNGSADDGREVSRAVSINKQEIDYQILIEKYATPVNYFIAMHVITADKQFMNEIVEKVLNTSTIVLSLEEKSTIHTIKVDYSGQITTTPYETKKEKSSTASNYLQDPSKDTYETTYGTSSTIEITNANINNYGDLINIKQYIIKHVTNDGQLYVTDADTWLLDSHLVMQQVNSDRNYIQQDSKFDTVVDEENTVIRNAEASGSFRKGIITETTNEWDENIDFVATDTGIGYDLEEFLSLINSNAEVKNKLQSSPSFLFYLLEQNQNTQELERVMKYVIFTLTDDDYGVTELNIFDTDSFIDVDSDDAFLGQEVISGTYTRIFNGVSYTYTNYKQPSGSDWCGITAAAIVLSGYGYSECTPTYIYKNYGYSWREALKQYLGGGNVGEYAYNISTGVEAQLNSGKPVIVHVPPNNGRYSTKSGHFFVLLDIRKNDGNIEFYVSDPGGNYVGQKRNGWVPKKIVLQYVDKYVIL